MQVWSPELGEESQRNRMQGGCPRTRYSGCEVPCAGQGLAITRNEEHERLSSIEPLWHTQTQCGPCDLKESSNAEPTPLRVAILGEQKSEPLSEDSRFSVDFWRAGI